jgi:pimeloyl-ACP methyl ester carboxylesterase
VITHLPRTSGQIVTELRLLLQSAGLAPPYVLAGHSFGAIHMTWYALHHPAEVAGLVQVATVAYLFLIRFPEAKSTLPLVLRFEPDLGQMTLVLVGCAAPARRPNSPLTKRQIRHIL